MSNYSITRPILDKATLETYYSSISMQTQSTIQEDTF